MPDTCVVCLDEFVTSSDALSCLPCGHVFHKECIDGFFNAQLSRNLALRCPLCNFDVSPTQPSAPIAIEIPRSYLHPEGGRNRVFSIRRGIIMIMTLIIVVVIVLAISAIY